MIKALPWMEGDCLTHLIIHGTLIWNPLAVSYPYNSPSCVESSWRSQTSAFEIKPGTFCITYTYMYDISTYLFRVHYCIKLHCLYLKFMIDLRTILVAVFFLVCLLADIGLHGLGRLLGLGLLTAFLWCHAGLMCCHLNQKRDAVAKDEPRDVSASFFCNHIGVLQSGKGNDTKLITCKKNKRSFWISNHISRWWKMMREDERSILSQVGA